MAIIDLGKVSITWRGAYDGSTAYTPKDAVSYQNASYICTANTTGNLPTDTSYWNVMAAKGADGTDLTSTLTTQGDLLYRDGSGLQRLAAGTSGQFLKTQGSGANPTWANAGGGQFQFVTRTAITSTVASVAFTNLEANNYHKFVFQGIDSTDNGGEDWAAQLSVDNGSSYLNSTYRYTLFQFYDSGNTNCTASGGGSSTTDMFKMADGFHSSGADEGLHGEYTLYNVGNGQRPFCMSQTTHKADSTNRLRGTVAAGFLESGVSVNAIKFFFDSGNITGSSYAFITHYKGIIA